MALTSKTNDMRTIKFRAWNTDYTQKPLMEYFNLNDLKAIERLSDKSIMQFTGLHDKNGKEIYYDDTYFDHYMNALGTVNELTVAHWIIDIDKMNDPMRHIEVVGNIYEND